MWRTRISLLVTDFLKSRKTPKFRPFLWPTRNSYLVRTCQTITIIEQVMDPGYKNEANLIEGGEEFGAILPRQVFRLELPRQQS